MMKVIHLISGGDTGGAKTHVITLLKELKNHMDVMLVCMMEGEFAKEARKVGIPVTVIVQKQRYDLSIVKELKDMLKKGKYDILHCHGARANFIAAFLKVFISIPIITTVHSDYRLDFTESLYKKWIYTNINAIALRQLPYYIAVTENFKRLLIKRHFNPDRIFVTYNGIDMNTLLPKKDPDSFLQTYGLSYDKSNIYVGSAVRLHPVKGIDILLKAACRIIQKHPNVHFLIAGDGETRSEYEKQIHQYQLESNVHLLGHVRDIYSFYHMIDMHVLSSYSEGFPYVLLECARQKKATISSDVGGIPEMIEDQKSGLLFPVGDVDLLTTHIENLVSNPEKRKVLGDAFYQRVQEYFSAEQMVKEHMNIYSKIRKEVNDEIYR